MSTKTIISALLVMAGAFLNTSDQVFSQSSGNVKSVALISTLLGKIVQSPIPLLDAGPFNKKTNSIAPLIIEEEVKSIDGIREAIATSIKNHLNCEVVYGNTLVAKPEYAEVIKKFNYPDGLRIDDENFPKIIIPKDEANLFRFTDGKKVANFLKDAENTQNTASEICKLLGTDFVAVSYSSMMVKSYGWFGGHADLCMSSFIYFYDREGKLAGYGTNISKTVSAVGDDVMDYRTVLNALPDILDKMMVKATKKMTAK